MDDIKPVAFGFPNTAITGKNHALMLVVLEIPSTEIYPHLWIPLYPESALLQAREEGRREGMREAAEIAQDEICNCCFEEGALEAAEHIAETIRARASEGKS